MRTILLKCNLLMDLWWCAYLRVTHIGAWDSLVKSDLESRIILFVLGIMEIRNS